MSSAEAAGSSSWGCWIRTFTAGLGSLVLVLIIGASEAQSAVMLPQLREEDSFIHVTPDQETWIASLGIVMAPFSALVIGPFIDAFGRKKGLQAFYLNTGLGFAVMAMARDVAHIYIGRIICGLGAGFYVCFNVYLVEICTQKQREFIFALGAAIFAGGLMVSNVINAFMPWNIAALVISFVCFVFFFLQGCIPESPAWLFKIGDEEASIHSLKRLGRNKWEIDHEINILRMSQIANSERFRNKLSCIRQELDNLNLACDLGCQQNAVSRLCQEFDALKLSYNVNPGSLKRIRSAINTLKLSLEADSRTLEGCQREVDTPKLSNDEDWESPELDTPKLSSDPNSEIKEGSQEKTKIPSLLQNFDSTILTVMNERHTIKLSFDKHLEAKEGIQTNFDTPKLSNDKYWESPELDIPKIPSDTNLEIIERFQQKIETRNSSKNSVSKSLMARNKQDVTELSIDNCLETTKKLTDIFQPSNDENRTNPEQGHLKQFPNVNSEVNETFQQKIKTLNLSTSSVSKSLTVWNQRGTMELPIGNDLETATDNFQRRVKTLQRLYDENRESSERHTPELALDADVEVLKDFQQEVLTLNLPIDEDQTDSELQQINTVKLLNDKTMDISDSSPGADSVQEVDTLKILSNDEGTKNLKDTPILLSNVDSPREVDITKLSNNEYLNDPELYTLKMSPDVHFQQKFDTLRLPNFEATKSLIVVSELDSIFPSLCSDSLREMNNLKPSTDKNDKISNLEYPNVSFDADSQQKIHARRLSKNEDQKNQETDTLKPSSDTDPETMDGTWQRDYTLKLTKNSNLGSPRGGHVVDALKPSRHSKSFEDAISQIHREFDTLGSSRSAATEKLTISSFFTPTVWKPFLIMVAFYFFQSASGIYIIIYYSVDLIERLGTDFDPVAGSLLLCTTRFLTGATVAILFRSKIGRKFSTAFSALWMTVALTGAGAYEYVLRDVSLEQRPLQWVPVALLVLYASTMVLGLLCLPWLMSGELFPLRVRGTAASATNAVGYVFIFISTKVYYVCAEELQIWGLLFACAAVTFVAIFFGVFVLPETHGKSLYEIEQGFMPAEDRQLMQGESVAEKSKEESAEK